MIKPAIVADLLSTFICLFLFTGPAFGVPFSAQKLPESVVDGDRTRWLDYQAQAGGLAAGLARDASAFDPTSRIFLLDMHRALLQSSRMLLTKRSEALALTTNA
jgi:hypothetical protein